MVDVVLPTPPFWLTMAMTRAGPWEDSGAGSGKSRWGAPGGAHDGVFQIEFGAFQSC